MNYPSRQKHFKGLCIYDERHKFGLISTVWLYIFPRYTIWNVVLNIFRCISVERRVLFWMHSSWGCIGALLFNALRHICGDICMWKFELLGQPPPPPYYPESIQDIPVWLYDSWLACRDKGVQINLLSSKWVSVTEEIKRFWSASQMTDASVLPPPRWPPDNPRLLPLLQAFQLPWTRWECLKTLG